VSIDLGVAQQAATNGTERSAIVVAATTITPETVSWLWPGCLAVGALANMVGVPDQGKSLIFTDVAARLTIGSPMPPEPHQPGQAPSQRVLILTLEDALSHTIVPRLIQAGADLAWVDFLQMVRNPDGHTSLLTLAEDLDVLDATLSTGRYALVVVDGITGYLGDAKTHNDGDVRRVLVPFAALLARTKVAGLSVMHPPKAVTNLAYYAGGSVAFTAIPRVTLGVAPDPTDESTSPRRLLMKIKGNLYGPVPTLAYRIVAAGPAEVPRIEWEPDPVAVNIADVLDPMKEDAAARNSRRACEEWLRAYLADGPQPAVDGEKAARLAGFTYATLRRARENVADVAKRSFNGPWVWKLKATPR
jgi:putative DNA primase/helicase